MGSYAEVALSTAAGFQGDLLDADERRAVALVAAWEAETKLLPRSMVATVTRRRLVDEVRAKHGRRGEKRCVPLDGFDGVEPAADLAGTVAVLADGDERTALMCWMLAAGFSKAEVAVRLGVSDGRVSQLLAAIRARHDRCEVA